jgi:hypothetical protein
MGNNLNTKRHAALRKLTKRLALLVVAIFLAPFVALAAPGDLDPTFGAGGKVSTTVFSANDPQCVDGCFLYGVDAVDVSGGNYLVSGICQLEYRKHLCVVKYLDDGSLDHNFANSGVAIVSNDFVPTKTKIAIHSDGSIFVAASCYYERGQRVCLSKLDSLGSIDVSFGVQGFAYANNTNSNQGSSGYDNSSDLRCLATEKLRYSHVVQGVRFRRITVCFGSIHWAPKTLDLEVLAMFLRSLTMGLTQSLCR